MVCWLATNTENNKKVLATMDDDFMWDASGSQERQQTHMAMPSLRVRCRFHVRVLDDLWQDIPKLHEFFGLHTVPNHGAEGLLSRNLVLLRFSFLQSIRERILLCSRPLHGHPLLLSLSRKGSQPIPGTAALRLLHVCEHVSTCGCTGRMPVTVPDTNKPIGFGGLRLPNRLRDSGLLGLATLIGSGIGLHKNANAG